MFTDSHCHLASHQFLENELSEVVSRAVDSGIHQMISLATNLEDMDANLRIAERYDAVSTCLAIHPCDVTETDDDYLSTLKDLAKHPKCVAIGETGLDYFHPAPVGFTEQSYRVRQREFLNDHFQLARELNKNIVIHTRDREGSNSLYDALEIYEDYHKDVTAVFHCFLGPWENAKRVLDLGGFLSFTGISTFKSAKECLDTAIQAPKSRFMLETDAPYLAPRPYRGKRNEPSYIKAIAEYLAAERGETLEELSKHTEEAVDTFFKFSK